MNKSPKIRQKDLIPGTMWELAEVDLDKQYHSIMQHNNHENDYDLQVGDIIILIGPYKDEKHKRFSAKAYEVLWNGFSGFFFYEDLQSGCFKRICD